MCPPTATLARGNRSGGSASGACQERRRWVSQEDGAADRFEILQHTSALQPQAHYHGQEPLDERSAALTLMAETALAPEHRPEGTRAQGSLGCPLGDGCSSARRPPRG